MRHLHPAFSQRQQASLRAQRLDVRAGQLILRHDKLLHVDILRQVHPRRVNPEDVPFGLDVGEGKLDLAIDAPRSEQRGVQGFNLVRRHDHLDVAPRFEPVHLGQEFDHRPLNLFFASRV